MEKGFFICLIIVIRKKNKMFRKIIFFIFFISVFSCKQWGDTNENDCPKTSLPPGSENCNLSEPNNDTLSIILLNPSSIVVDSMKILGLSKIDSCNCDLNLQLWGSKGQPIYGNDGLAKSSNGGGGGAGGGNEITNLLKRNNINFSPNYIVKSEPINLDTLTIKTNNQVSASNANDVIGVIDSGVSSDRIWTNTRENAYNANLDDDNNGFNGDMHGWNFVKKNADILNLGINNLHGTRVSSLIERSLKKLNSNYSILPMVVLDKDNKGYLFDFICALAYSLKLNEQDVNMKFINASLSYYGYGSNVLEEYICKLKYKNINLIVSAGNKSKNSDCNNSDNPNLSLRMLKSYPACLSSIYGNVKAITSITDKIEGEYTIPEEQKFSNNFVTLGVEVDESNGAGMFLFKEINNETHLIEEIHRSGSSYATPIATAYYFLQSKNLLNDFEYRKTEFDILMEKTVKGNGLVFKKNR